MFNDSIISTRLGYTPGPTAGSYNARTSQNPNFGSMTYNNGTPDDPSDDVTYTCYYETTYKGNVMGDYVPGPEERESVYTITAKYGAYIGDRWPSPSNDNFEFINDNNKSMYIWAAYYGSLYCGIAHARAPLVSDKNQSNPDINGIYQYMSEELCANRDGTDIINANQVHHLVAWYGNTNNNDKIKHYHIYYAAIDGTYDPESITDIAYGESYLKTPDTQTSWSNKNGKISKMMEHAFYEVSDTEVVSNLQPVSQLGTEIEGYDLVYSCYTSSNHEHDIYFFYVPQLKTLTFMYEDRQETDTYYYTQTLVGADKYDDPEKEGHRFCGWYTNASGAGSAFDFEHETMPSSNLVLYPNLKILQYKVKIDPNGGVIDHRNILHGELRNDGRRIPY